MEVKNSIRRLRKISLLLFIIPTIALLGSLIIHNYLISFDFSYSPNYKIKENIPGNSIKILCNEENNYCKDITYEKYKSLGKCYKYEVLMSFVTDSGIYVDVKEGESLSDKHFKKHKEKIYTELKVLNKLNENCISNKNKMVFYKIFPLFYELVYKIKNNNNSSFGSSNSINPFFHGETSISNVVKRIPLSYFFKPLIYLGVVLMIFYWLYYNRILKNLLNTTKNYYFFKFGILSASFLLLHVFFLGWTFENEILTKLRRTLVIFFILFEVLAQTFLIKQIFSIKDKINNYLNLIIVYLKLLFVFLVCSSTIIILTILIFYDLDAKFDYILEWNYFLLLLIFYFLSFLMWKKLIRNPASS